MVTKPELEQLNTQLTEQVESLAAKRDSIREQLEARKVLLESEQQQLLNDLNAIGGGIQTIEWVLALGNEETEVDVDE